MLPPPGVVILPMSSVLRVLHDGLHEYRVRHSQQRDPSLPIWQIGHFDISTLFEECVLAAFRGETHPEQAMMMLERAGLELESIKEIVYATVNEVLGIMAGAFPYFSLQQIDRCLVDILPPCDVMVTLPRDRV